jgi:dihydrofolate reductase
MSGAGTTRSRPLVSIIVAVAENGVIGRAGQLAVRIPADLARLKRLTMGHHLIMGRRTFESIGRPLPGRTTIVLTRNPAYAAVGCAVSHDLEAAIRVAALAGDREVFVLGGAEVYAAALPLADRLYLTRVHASLEGDTRFPPLPGGWRDTWSEEHPEGTPCPYSFVNMERRGRQ